MIERAPRWDRALAEVVDGAVLVVPVLVLGWPFLSRILGAGWPDLGGRLGDAGSLQQASVPASPVWPLVGLLLVATLLALAYRIATWLWQGATLGQRLLGLRVRPVRTGERLVVRHVYVRAGVQWVFLPLLAIPAVGCAALLWLALDVAWTLGDRSGRTLHDVLAGTRVVSTIDADAEWEATFQPRSDLDLYEDQSQ